MAQSAQPAGWRIEPLGRIHDRSTFSCGKDPLDRYIRQQVSQDVRKNVAAAFVLCEGQSNEVRGYYTLSSLSIDIGQWPPDIARRFPRYPQVPVTLMGRLATDTRLQGQRAGEHLLMDALHRALAASKTVASVAVIVDAKDQKAASFYEQYGFTRFPDDQRRMFLPMATIEAGLGASSKRA